ncbi:WD40-repeat-containing domain protein [Trametes gibbosa]|nr:WD40-repeat-containing domain protein [Trametes gibbosa]
MHMMPNNNLLAASLQYGIVSRSYPMSGKVLRGFLDASGTANGLGIGNPNAEFSPHISSTALASEGGTAKILWGYRNGEVAVTTAVRVMDNNRASAARLVRCRLGDCHEGAVDCVAWDRNADSPCVFASGGADGRVKLWRANSNTTLACLWTSKKGASLITDPCTKLAIDLQQGILVAALRSGCVQVWIGFPSPPFEPTEAAALAPCEIRIPASSVPATFGSSPYEDASLQVSDVWISPQRDRLSILVAYHSSSQFHRLTWSASLGAFERTSFGHANAGPIRSLLPVWASREEENSFVIVGDELGAISVFPWDAQSPEVQPIHWFAAHEDGAVTALQWNSAVLVSGSSRGTVKVWDALTFAPLRAFSSPGARPATGAERDGVNQILLDRDALMVSVGSRVMAWKAGPVGRSGLHGKGKTVRTAKNSGMAKWHQHLEMYREIADSRRELEEEHRHTQHTFVREREQLSTLAHLGLSEVEAVEYVLMLSRDEQGASSRPAELPSTVKEDEGVFMVDFDDLPTPMATPGTVFDQQPSALSSPSSGNSSPTSGADARVQHARRTFPRAMPSTSNHKVQVSPRFLPEPMEAETSVSPQPSRNVSSSDDWIHSYISDVDHFPAVSHTPPATSGGSGAATSSPSTSASSVKESVVGSPRSIGSAWSTPLRSLHSSEAPSPSHTDILSPSQSPISRSSSGASGGSLLYGQSDDARPSVDEDDEDLRFVIELSLAEARSRGEDI